MIKKFILILSMVGLSGCRSYEDYHAAGPAYFFNGKNIYLLEWTRNKNVFMRSSTITSLKYIPFIIDRSGKEPRFIRYCDIIEYEGSYEPFDEKAREKIEIVAVIEKSCGVKNVSLISYNSGGSLGGFHDEEKNVVQINVGMPKPGSVNKPPSDEEANANLDKLVNDAILQAKNLPVPEPDEDRRTITFPLPNCCSMWFWN
jgi:hypothetical protein